MPLVVPRVVSRSSPARIDIGGISRRVVLLGGLVAALVTPAAAAPHRKRAATSKAAASKAGTSKPAAEPPRPVIVIDPGHGGRDPGAIGISGTPEKTVTLAAALELKRQLEATRRYRVRMTRTDDRTVSLPDRVAFARAQGAVLLISIHADSAPTSLARGATVFIRAPEAPTRRVAARPREIGRALAGDSQESGWLRRLLIERLDEAFDLANKPAREADLYVLRASGMASVLLEMGFLTNRRDEAALRQPKHQAAMAQAIREAVDAYFERIRTRPAKRA
jgi:N-acetylmuramoyl-L-alanine amidase